MTLPTTKPNDRDLDWYVRECESLDERNKMLEAENAELKRVIDDPHAMQIHYRRLGNGWDVCSTERVQALHRDNERLERENAELRERLHIADAEIDMWASRCAAAIWLMPEQVTGGQLREAQDKFHRMLHAARKEAQP